jgi:uncharacterized protein DUF1194
MRFADRLFVAKKTIAVAGAAAVAAFGVSLAEAQSISPGRPAVDLALVLAVDASGSISDDRWDLERRGYAQAFRDPEVIRVIRSGPAGAIAVTLVEWSGEFQQSQVVGWALVNDSASAGRFANALVEMPHLFRSWTSISAGMAFGAELLATAPFEAPRRVIDVSGDGPDSTSELIIQGTPGDVDRLRKTRDRLIATGLVINGLPIFGDPRIRAIDVYYETNVIGGPGSFEVVAEDFTVFAMAVRRKLLLEIAAAATSIEPVVLAR